MMWNITSDRPIYQQLTEGLTERIVSGVYPPGGKVPAVRELAAEAGVNPNTMQRALADLEREGLLYTQRTRGRFVTEDEGRITHMREQIAKTRIDDFLGSMRLLGFTSEETLRLLAQAAQTKGDAQ
ncbi:MAG: GntR family transcriptional regulator [Clostridia bacterium]|nr:GntR family transcriptional regulator [Clostridia bacterium]